MHALAGTTATSLRRRRQRAAARRAAGRARTWGRACRSLARASLSSCAACRCPASPPACSTLRAPRLCHHRFCAAHHLLWGWGVRSCASSMRSAHEALFGAQCTVCMLLRPRMVYAARGVGQGLRLSHRLASASALRGDMHGPARRPGPSTPRRASLSSCTSPR